MRQELDDRLCAKYPRMFVERNASPEESAMCWGVECGDGWYPLIDSFCIEVERLYADKRAVPVVITQIKSKCGSLRIHFRNGDARVRAMVDLVRTLSECIDEESGQLQKPR